METFVNQPTALLAPPPAHNSQAFPPLEHVTRPTATTEEAAYYLNRQPQTLRAWACLENGPIRPVRINGRLAWPITELRQLLCGVAK
ncbi:MAG: DNA-binding protein [Gallionella sp.]|nr:DNA-binding protein [Gallionella sp.]